MRSAIASFVIVTMASAGNPATPTDAELAKGIRLVEQGEYGQAIIALDPVARRLDQAPAQKAQAAQAYLYLGIAYVGDGQDALARASLRKALDRNASLELSAFDVTEGTGAVREGP